MRRRRRNSRKAFSRSCRRFERKTTSRLKSRLPTGNGAARRPGCLEWGAPAAPPARFGVAPLAPEPYPRPRPSGGAGPLGSNVRPLRFSGVQATVVHHDTNTVVWACEGFGKEVLEKFFKTLTSGQGEPGGAGEGRKGGQDGRHGREEGGRAGQALKVRAGEEPGKPHGDAARAARRDPGAGRPARAGVRHEGASVQTSKYHGREEGQKCLWQRKFTMVASPRSPTLMHEEPFFS